MIALICVFRRVQIMLTRVFFLVTSPKIADNRFLHPYLTHIFWGNKKGGRTVETAAPALFAFMGTASSFGGLSALRWASAPPRFGNRCFRIGQRKPIIRTHLLSETGSDYIGLSCVDKKDADNETGRNLSHTIQIRAAIRKKH